MSIALQINVSDLATPKVNALISRTSPKRLAAKLGPPLMRHWRDHLKGLPGNRRGWPSTNFWEEAADSIQFFPTTDGLILTGSKQGLRFRFYGGTLKPVNAEALTIPISPISYGHTASEFPGLFLLKTKKGAYLVQYGTSVSSTGRSVKITKGGGNSGRRMKAMLNFLFRLEKSVTQKGNPNVIPDDLDAVASRVLMEAVQ